MTGRTIYLDNAAAGWPNPPEVVAAVAHFLKHVGANPGRSGHQAALEAARVVYRAREAVAGLLGLADPLRVVFTANATQALNLALYGLLGPTDHCVTTSMEHNSVMRPLRDLEARGTRLTVVPCSPEGELDPSAVEEAITPETTLIVMNHASNVVGTILPVADVAAIAQAHAIPLLVDAAQSAGAIPFDMQTLGIDLLAFTGHKALLGPTGTGGLLINETIDPSRIRPLIRGGTGSESEAEAQPDFLPDRFEAGTLNAAGLAGLAAAIDWLAAQGLDAIRDRACDLTDRLIEGLRETPRVEVYGTLDAGKQVGVVSFNLQDVDPADVDMRLSEGFGISARVGLQCAPSAHKTVGTFPRGTVRVSLGPFTTADDIDYAVGAVRAVARSATRARPSRSPE